jgi:hypothetical protein
VTDAQEILRLIETVDPNDTAKLDEIDARVWCVLNSEQFVCMSLSEPAFVCGSSHYASCDKNLSEIPSYTRSRDALKQIRPEGWYYEGGSGYALMWGPHADTPPYERPELYGSGRTEELLELHAIISAIEYERTQQNKSP